MQGCVLGDISQPAPEPGDLLPYVPPIDEDLPLRTGARIVNQCPGER